MTNRLQTLVTACIQRRNRTVTAFAVGVVLAVGVGYLVIATPASAPSETAVSETAGTSATTTLILPMAEPTQIRIPEIGVDAAFEAPVGLESSGEIGTPGGYETVAYYEYGPAPGSLGPAVVLGHVDSYQGPAVFYSLGQLKPGNLIYIDRDDGTTAVFTVVDLERYPQSDFPTAQVYSDLPYAGLRLITCTGVYNHGTLRYSHNLVVYAELTATSTSAAGG